ncbi:MAG: FixH family protein [Acidobacteria bacterium]|nr:FixH family protein [Acidobacteriota bacterium]
MKSMDKRSLLSGMLVGVLAAALVFGALIWFRPGHEGSAQPAPGSPPSHGPGQPDGHVEAPSEIAGQVVTAAPGTVELSPEEQRVAGVQIVEVRRRNLAGSLMAVGRVEEAETSLATISARVGGRIDKLYVDFTGQSVRKGQPIAMVYSPEVVSASEEYRLALESLEGLGPAALPEAQAHARQLVDASRRRLELWGLTAEQIRELSKSGEPRIHITIYSPASGTVMERKVTEGQYVREGDPLYSVSDLSTVWVKADVYESDLPLVRIGQTVEITSEALPGSRLRGRVSFIEPMLNQQTRTVPVRIQVPNPGLRLRPGMYANARLMASLGESVLAVPRSAVLETGTRRVVYVAKGDGVFEGRQVDLGPSTEDYVAVLAGLREGERVVTQGNFLIDAQSRLTGGLTGLFGGSKEFAQTEQEPAAAAGENWKVTFKSNPDPAKGGAENGFHVSVVGPDGRPVSDAEVSVQLLMPAMPAMGMGEMRQSARLQWSGSEYAGKANIPMAGSWNVTVKASRGGKKMVTHRTRLDAR